MKGDPAEFMVRQAKAALPESVQQAIPRQAEQAIIKLLPLCYGMSFGVFFAAVCRQAKHHVGEGILLGLTSWAVGFLGWLPRTGLMPPVSAHHPKQVLRPVLEHALYGVATVESYRWLKRLARV